MLVSAPRLCRYANALPVISPIPDSERAEKRLTAA